jgi:hypothetical protein
MPANHEVKVSHRTFSPATPTCACSAKGHGSLSPQSLSRSAPRLFGRPRVEDLVACGAHQIHTQGTCTREVGGRESGRGRERKRAGASVVWRERGGRACTFLLTEGGTHAPSVAILLFFSRQLPYPVLRGLKSAQFICFIFSQAWILR